MRISYGPSHVCILNFETTFVLSFKESDRARYNSTIDGALLKKLSFKLRIKEVREECS